MAGSACGCSNFIASTRHKFVHGRASHHATKDSPLPMRYARSYPIRFAFTSGLSLLILALPCAARAQSVGSRIDQPTPGTLPAGTHNADSSTAPANQPTGRVAPPSAISSSTDVMKGGPVQGGGSSGKVNPIEHLPENMKR